MEPRLRSVKRKRRYDSAGRLQQATRTRTLVLDSAQRLFLQNGYAATTVASIAASANVSVETIYKAFSGKPGLVRAIRDRGLGGHGPVHAEQRSDRMRMAERDPRQIILNWGSLAAEVAPGSARSFSSSVTRQPLTSTWPGCATNWTKIGIDG